MTKPAKSGIMAVTAEGPGDFAGIPCGGEAGRAGLGDKDTAIRKGQVPC